MYEVYNGKMFSRIAALIVDLIIVLCIFVTIDILITKNVANNVWQYDDKVSQYENYQIDYGIAHKDAEGNLIYVDDVENSTLEAFKSDESVLALAQDITTLQIIQISFDLFVSEILVFFVLPLIFKNGQTLGKKLMRLGLVNSKGLKVANWAVFARFIIGIYAVESIISVLTFSPVPLLLSFLIALFTKKKTALHDLIAGTRVIDIDKTIIFETFEEKSAAIEEYEKTKKKEEELKLISA